MGLHPSRWPHENGVRVAPPEIRCQGKHWSGRQCAKPAIRGTRFCRSHRRGAQPKSRHKTSARSLLQGLPVFYSRVLGKTLEKRVKECVERPPHEQVAAYEELALIRDQCANVVQVYGAVVDAHADGKATMEQLITSGELMKEACAFVIEQCAKIQQMEQAAKDKISVYMVAMLAAQMTRIMYRVCGEEHVGLARQFEELVKAEVKLPRTDAEGTSITPDQDVLDMDDTVPRDAEVGILEGQVITHDTNEGETDE